VFYFLIAISSTGGGDWVDYTGCLMWCPAGGALLATRYLGRSISTIAWRWGQSRYEVAGYLIPLGYVSLIYVFVWTMGFGGFYNGRFVDLFAKDFGFGSPSQPASITFYFFFTATISVVKDAATVLGEEIGWIVCPDSSVVLSRQRILQVEDTALVLIGGGGARGVVCRDHLTGTVDDVQCAWTQAEETAGFSGSEVPR
jgi:hypothetical protein